MPLTYISKRDDEVMADAIVRFFKGDALSSKIKACNYQARYYIDVYGDDEESMLKEALMLVSRYHLKRVCFNVNHESVRGQLRAYLNTHEFEAMLNITEGKISTVFERYSYLEQLVAKKSKVLLTSFKLNISNTYETPFASYFEKMLANHNCNELEVMRRSNSTRLNYSAIRYGSVNPSKENVYALALGAGLDVEETKELIKAAHHPGDDDLDRIVRDFIDKGIHDIDIVNEALFAYNIGQLSV